MVDGIGGLWLVGGGVCSAGRGEGKAGGGGGGQQVTSTEKILLI